MSMGGEPFCFSKKLYFLRNLPECFFAVAFHAAVLYEIVNAKEKAAVPDVGSVWFGPAM